MRVYACTQFNNVIKFKFIKKFIENLRRLSTISRKKTYNECIYFEENTTCLNLMDKNDFPTLQLHSLTKGISLYNKVVREHVYSDSVLIYTGSQYFWIPWLVFNIIDLIFPIQVLIYINTKVLNTSFLLKIQNIYRSNFFYMVLTWSELLLLLLLLFFFHFNR